MVVDRLSFQQYPGDAEVPEGSILGPAFFLLYINDICDIAIYADTTLF